MPPVAKRLRLPAGFNLEQATRAIVAEEAWGKIFVNNNIELWEGVRTNFPKFDYYHDEVRSYPPDCKILKAEDSPPLGYSLQWEGFMLISNEETPVKLYRSLG